MIEDGTTPIAVLIGINIKQEQRRDRDEQGAAGFLGPRCDVAAPVSGVMPSLQTFVSKS